MKFEYEFEGHDLTKWGNHGGLPVTLIHKFDHLETWDQRLVLISESDYYVSENLHDSVSKEIYECLLRYSKLEDVIDQKPKWANYFAVMGGMGFWFEDMGSETKPSTHHKEILGHLFDDENYWEPVEL